MTTTDIESEQSEQNPEESGSQQQRDQDNESVVEQDPGDDSNYADEDISTLSQAELAEALVVAREQIKEMKDGYLRAKAEMENIRRRSQKEVIAARKFAIEGFAQEVLNVKDSLDQAAAMVKFAVVEVEAGPGVKFDPEQHQAISMVPSDEFESNHIVNVMQKGFILKERLLRPAMVVVAS